MRRHYAAAAVFSALWALAALYPDPTHGAPQGPAPTFSKEVVRIFQNNCQTCHHPGDIAPFSLMTYEDTAPWADSIKEMTTSRQMPPWKPVVGCETFQGDRRLSDDDIATIARWVDAGAPEGNPTDLPESIQFPDEWKLGNPDVEYVTAAHGFTIPADATSDIYRCFPVATDFSADRYITGVEIRAGNRTVVHHVLVFIDALGRSVALDNADPGPGYTSFGGVGFDPTGYLGAWAPGASPVVAPTGSGIKVPRGAHLVIQVHYSLHDADAAGQTDQTKLGLHFARTPVTKELLTEFILTEDFMIPAGDSHHEVTTSLQIPAGVDVTLHGLFPHMHLLGREMSVDAVSPTGASRCLISIDDWDFHWQGMYRFTEPISIPGGSRINVDAFYDNSANNLENPNTPPKDVRFGEQTTDEMCLAIAEFTVDAQNLPTSSPAVTGVNISGPKFVVSGSGLQRGAFIEVNGALLYDTKAKSKKATSKADWQAAIPTGTPVTITVLNPDGARSAAVSFTR